MEGFMDTQFISQFNTHPGSQFSQPAGARQNCDFYSLDQAKKNISSRKEIVDRLHALRREKLEADEDWRNPYAVTTADMATVLYGEKTKDERSSQKAKKPLNYNFREITGKILRAKTSLSASQAVISAKQKVRELKRKLASAENDSDTEEIALALDHAKKIERVARKKQRHLELEELVSHTRKHDEAKEKQEQSAEDIDAALESLKEEELDDRQTELDGRENAMFTEAVATLKDQGTEISEDMITSLDTIIESMFEEEQSMIDEMRDLMDASEVLDPHMSEEQFERLKTKHRNSENKEIVKADADYWKAMMEHGTNRISQAMSPMLGFASIIDVSSMPSAADIASEGFSMLA
jgi:hypothetical protein